MEAKSEKKKVADKGDEISGDVKTAGRPRKEATVTDMILKLKEVKVIAGQIAQQRPIWKMRLRGITRMIDRWLSVTLKRIENDPAKD